MDYIANLTYKYSKEIALAQIKFKSRVSKLSPATNVSLIGNCINNPPKGIYKLHILNTKSYYLKEMQHRFDKISPDIKQISYTEFFDFIEKEIATLIFLVNFD